MKKKKTGFSLIEAMVAIVIIFLSIGASAMMISSNTKTIEKNRNRLSAVYLAEECLELVRNERDSNWKKNELAFKNFDDENASYRIEKQEKIDQDGESFISIKIDKNPESYILTKNGSWINHEEGGKKTQFERKITLSEVKKGRTKEGSEKIDSAIFTCEVSWKEKKGKDGLSLSLLLSDWKK